MSEWQWTGFTFGFTNQIITTYLVLSMAFPSDCTFGCNWREMQILVSILKIGDTGKQSAGENNWT